jgi:hypothetical protein
MEFRRAASRQERTALSLDPEAISVFDQLLTYFDPAMNAI